MSKSDNICQWVSLKEALSEFVSEKTKTESSEHIKPLHWYIACRLVLEGGFHPDEIVPRPPFVVGSTRGEPSLEFDPKSGESGELIVLGGLKTKRIDVVVSKNGIGPVMAISVKGTKGAFRNLTNRLEEAVGDCTNIHIAYPALVYGFLSVLQANRDMGPQDSALIRERGRENPSETILRYCTAMSELAGRSGIRSDQSRYEGISIGLVEPKGNSKGELLQSFPEKGSPLRFEGFFKALYEQYDER
ncbi:MAG TPA: hypothetical protein PL001_04145, partial [Candidatus Kryptobacter bacterium]|nr:hypothetical protein [Candidatus Kryptobacter bacterium]